MLDGNKIQASLSLVTSFTSAALLQTQALEDLTFLDESTIGK